MKSSKGLTIFLICLLSFLAIVIAVFLVFILTKKVKPFNLNFNIPSNKISENILFDESYEKSPEKINVVIDAGDLEINNSNEDKISVKIYADEKNIKDYNVTFEEDLDIKIKENNCVGICFNNAKSKVVIMIPKNYDKALTINSKYGDVKIGSFENINLIASLDAGNIEIEKVNSASIDNDYGNIKIESVNDATIKESAGNVKIGSVKNVAVVNDYGNITIDEVLEFMDLKNDCGNIKITDAKITKNSKIECDLGNVSIKNIEKVFIDTKTDVGKAKINNNDRKSDVTLTIKNDYGNIKVNN